MATSFLQQRAFEVKSNRVNWQTYLQSKVITQDEYILMTKLDGTHEQRSAQLVEKPTQCFKMLLHLMLQINKEQTVQYIVTMIDDLLQEDKSRAQVLYNSARSEKDSIWDQFLSLIRKPDKYAANQSAQIIAKLACWTNKDSSMDINSLSYYMTWLKEQLKMPKNDYLETIARCLQMSLRVLKYRQQFVENDGVNAIVTVLGSKVGFQLQYQFVFCLWVITFDPQLANKVSKCNVIPTLSDILSESAKEKVTRIVVASLRNLLEKPTEREYKRENSLAMVQCKVLKHLQLMEGKKFEDTDITDDVQYLVENLEVSIQDVSSFDEYSTEIRSGRLEWSIVHRSEKFWSENVSKINEKNYELLKLLVSVLEKSHDPLVLSVAVHDLGQYVRHNPRGKTMVEQLGGKQLIMRGLAHTDPNVRYESLIALQKVMVHNWEFLGKQLEAPTAPGKEKEGSAFGKKVI